MRIFASVRLPIFRALAPRVGFISAPIGGHRYNAHQINSSTLLPEHHPFAGTVAVLVLFSLALGLYFLFCS